MLIRVMYVREYLFLFPVCVGRSCAECCEAVLCSPLSARGGGCGSVPPSARSLLVRQMHIFDFFYLAWNLEMAFLFCVVGFSLLSLASSWHTGMPKAIIEKKKNPPSSLFPTAAGMLHGWMQRFCGEKLRGLAAELIQPGPLLTIAKQML